MAEVLIGTSGYSYTDWVGPFYPEGTAKAAFLKYYAAHFSFVELNFSYYRQPDPGMLTRMLGETPANFRFAIKAHQSLTHKVELDWKKDAAEYRNGIYPLMDSGRLSAVLLQFPYSFHYEADNRLYLAELCDELRDLPLVLEFRGAEWQTDRVYDELRKRAIGVAAADYPNLKNLPKPDPVTTSQIGYVRFHGRNRENWWGGTNASRYDYLYNSDELDQWLEKITRMSQNSGILVLVFNNHWRGKAIQNATELKEKIQAATDLIVR